jgi:hypothetical protein
MTGNSDVIPPGFQFNMPGLSCKSERFLPVLDFTDYAFTFTSYPRMLLSRWAQSACYGTICLWVTGWSLFWH